MQISLVIVILLAVSSNMMRGWTLYRIGTTFLKNGLSRRMPPSLHSSYSRCFSRGEVILKLVAHSSSTTHSSLATTEADLRSLLIDIDHHNYLYHQMNEPSISDQEFDALIKRAHQLHEQLQNANISNTSSTVNNDITLTMERAKVTLNSVGYSVSTTAVSTQVKKSGPIATSIATVPFVHSTPMLSLDNAFSVDELQSKFLHKVG